MRLTHQFQGQMVKGQGYILCQPNPAATLTVCIVIALLCLTAIINGCHWWQHCSAAVSVTTMKPSLPLVITSNPAMPVLFLLCGPRIGFSPHRVTRCPDKREIWHGGADQMPTPPCQISCLSAHKCGNTASKTVKISNLAINLFAQFLRNFQILWASTGTF